MYDYILKRNHKEIADKFTVSCLMERGNNILEILYNRESYEQKSGTCAILKIYCERYLLYFHNQNQRKLIKKFNHSNTTNYGKEIEHIQYQSRNFGCLF